MSAALRVNGVLMKGLTKSSSTTAAIEFKPVDSELEKYSPIYLEKLFT